MQAPITQNDIEDIILDFIELQGEKIKESIKSELEGYEKEIEELQEAANKFEAFENKHKEELESIWPIRTFPFQGKGSYLFFAFNELSCHYQCIQMSIEQTKKWKIRKDGFIQVTYGEMEEGTVINQKSLKKYIQILQDKGLLFRKNGLGGSLYKIVEKS